MKENSTNIIKAVMADRGYFSLVVAVVMAALIYALYVALSVESRDIQVVSHYSGFGESHFYKTPWYSLYLFAATGLITGLINAAIMIKFYAYDRRAYGVYVGWITLLVLVAAAAWTIKVFGVAYL